MTSKSWCIGEMRSGNDMTVDRFDGTSYRPDIFRTVTPICCGVNFRPEDVKMDEFTYLILGMDSHGAARMIKICGEDFSLVETDMDILVNDAEGEI